VPAGEAGPPPGKLNIALCWQPSTILSVNDEQLPPSVDTAGPFATIAVLDNEIEAQVLDDVLTDRHIPHRMVSYGDSAFGGVFQGAGGWGRVDAPAAFRAEVEAVIAEIQRQPPGDPEDTPGIP
jgi:hypothetical protein